MNVDIENVPDRLSGIYKINFPNGKYYIGKAVDIKRRIKEHNTDKRQPTLYAAVQKYFNGKVKNFEILEIVLDREKLSKREQYYIALYKSNDKNKGYNQTSGGDGAALGINNVASKFSIKDIKNIQYLLKNTDIPIYQIAEQYNCNRNTISRLNQGETYFDLLISYPIRKNKYISKSGCKNGNAKISEQVYQLLIKDLKNSTLSLSDICKKYNISFGTLSKINNGKSYFHEKMIYPIRIRKKHLK